MNSFLWQPESGLKSFSHPLSLILPDGHVAFLWPRFLLLFPTWQTAPLFYYSPFAVISCQLTGKRPVYKFNTQSWHLSCSCQLPQTCRLEEWRGNVATSIFTRFNWNIYTNPSQLALHWINTACFPPCEQMCWMQTLICSKHHAERQTDKSARGLCTSPPHMLKKERLTLFIHLFTPLCFHLLALEADSRILIVRFLPGFCVKRGSITSPRPTQEKGQSRVLQGGPFRVHKGPLHVAHWTFLKSQNTAQKTILNPAA